jgi:RecA/RadA recombinase
MLNKSVLTNEKTVTVMPVLGMNIATSGELFGGFHSGVTQWAGPSKHFKTLFALIQVKSYLDQFPDSVCILYDSEFGAPMSYFESLGIDPARIIHIPVLTLEELRTEMVNQLQEIKRGDKVIMMIDSVGNLASKKETDDAIAAKEAADLTRAKVAKSLFRIVTPHFSLKDIPLVFVNHTYQTLEVHSRQQTGGGTGGYYAADNIFIIGRQQDRPAGGEVRGYDFVINVEKSRYTKEKSKIPIYVSMTGGLDRYSGMGDLAVEAELLQSASKKGNYFKVDPETGVVDDKQYPMSKIEADREWMKQLTTSERFQTFVKNKYQLASSKLLNDEE